MMDMVSDADDDGDRHGFRSLWSSSSSSERLHFSSKKTGFSLYI